MVGNSLTIAIFFVLVSKSLLLKCFAVLQLEFFSLAKNRLAEILCVFQENILQLKGKKLGQNRIMSYETPPKTLRLFYLLMMLELIEVIADFSDIFVPEVNALLYLTPGVPPG